MTERIGKASLTMRPRWRIVLSCQFHIDRASLRSPFYQVARRVGKTSIRVVVNPASVGLGSWFLPGTAWCRRNGAPSR
jgi:hypothetical protein